MISLSVVCDLVPLLGLLFLPFEEGDENIRSNTAPPPVTYNSSPRNGLAVIGPP